MHIVSCYFTCFYPREGAGVVQAVLQAWGHLRSWWQGEVASRDTKALTLAVLTKVITVNSKVITVHMS